jgi:AcrR family transcriptional regulator
MAPSYPRDALQTRQRISEVATTLFLERGFDEVTVNEVARAAGVSKVTLFHYFARKEDLLLDRTPEALDLLRNRLDGVTSPLEAIREIQQLAVDLLDARHPLSGLSRNSIPFMRTINNSAALQARAREMADEIEQELALFLRAASSDPGLLATLIIAAYRHLLVTTARRLLNGDVDDEVVRDHNVRIARTFNALVGAASLLV